MIKERLEKEKEQENKDTVERKGLEKKPPTPPVRYEQPNEDPKKVSMDDLADRIGDPKRSTFIKPEYQGRETISASIPGWIKAAIDYIAAKDAKYSGFGGKSKFISEALMLKVQNNYPDLYNKLVK